MSQNFTNPLAVLVTITNNTNGYMTLNGLTNGSDYPPVTIGSPPIIVPFIGSATTQLTAISALGELNRITYPKGYTQLVPNGPTGQTSFNLPDNSILTIIWTPINSNENINCNFEISSPSIYQIEVTSSAQNGSNCTYAITVEPKS